jgi:HlyD family secretion protein
MNIKRVALLIVVVAAVGWIAWAFWHAYQPGKMVLQGQIEAQQYSVASKIPGRISEVLVRRGDQIEVGQLVFTIDSPELEAKLEQARGTEQVAGAVETAADRGAREQEKLAAYDQWQTAKAAEDLASKTYERLQNLFDEGVASEQRRDEAFAAYQATQYTAQAAYQLYSLAEEGTRDETRDAAAGQVRAASGLVAEAEALKNDLRIESAFRGEVSNVFLHPGELAPQGFPVVTVIDISQAWAVFQVREDLLQRVPKGSEINVLIPSLGDQSFVFEVHHVSVMGDFATWRATSSTQGYDLRTFEVEARPSSPIEGLRAGMTVLLEFDD